VAQIVNRFISQHIYILLNSIEMYTSIFLEWEALTNFRAAVDKIIRNGMHSMIFLENSLNTLIEMYFIQKEVTHTYLYT
jgi:hypothetical protein